MKNYDIWNERHDRLIDMEITDDQARDYEEWCERHPDKNGYIKVIDIRRWFGRDIYTNIRLKGVSDHSKVYAIEIL